MYVHVSFSFASLFHSSKESINSVSWCDMAMDTGNWNNLPYSGKVLWNLRTEQLGSRANENRWG
jgi:hypothetical protein